MSMDAFGLHDEVRPLGLPSEIAESAATQYRQRSFSGRHPIVAFVGMPIVLLPLLWTGFFLGTYAVLLVIDSLGVDLVDLKAPWPMWGRILMVAILYGMIQVPIALAAIFVCRLANKAALDWKWPMLGCLLLAMVSIQLCPVVDRNSTNGLWAAYFVLPYMDLPLGYYGLTHLSGKAIGAQIFQFALPLAIALWAVRSQLAAALPNWRRLSTG